MPCYHDEINATHVALESVAASTRPTVVCCVHPHLALLQFPVAVCGEAAVDPIG